MVGTTRSSSLVQLRTTRLLRRHVPQARQILRKLLVDRVVFTPRTDHYEFVGPWTLGKLVSGVVDLPQRMASPTGFEPVSQP